jgi:AbrB family looped-hinge helix DNA binding protein
MKITSKGQVTIPLEIRERMGLFPGTQVEFIEEQGRVYVKKLEGRGRGRELIERMAGKATVKMTTDEIMALTRGDD